MSRRRLPWVTGLCLLSSVTLHAAAASAEAPVASAVPLEVLAHIQDVGDRTFAAGQWAGSRGDGRQLEGFRVGVGAQVREGPEDLAVRCMAHLQDSGDTAWTSGFVGTRGQLRRIEGFACRLTGRDAGLYDLRYRAHIRDVGDTPTFSNGAFCGTRGQWRRVEALQVWVERRSSPRSDVAVDLLVHADGAALPTVSAGQWGGTPGDGRRIEGFHVHLRDAAGLSARCMGRFQVSGETARMDGFVGTRGGSDRLQGFACELAGERASEFHILYRGHLLGGSDTLPAADGTFCGTREPNGALDAIQLWIVRRAAP